MATLAERLNGIKAAFAKQADEATRDVMHRATQALIDSGQADRAVGEGATMPAFTAPAADGRSVSSDQLLGAGPLIVTFFRGHW